MIGRAMAMMALLGAAPGTATAPPAATRGSPAVAAPLTMPDMPLHDPWIVADRSTGTYHLFTKNEPRMTGDPTIGIMAYTSRDLKHWTRPRLVFALPAGGWADAGAWAPEVHRWKGRWYLFATFHNEKAPLPTTQPRPAIRRATTLAAADRLGGPFAAVRNLAPLTEPDRMTLDGTLYVDPAGKPWLVYAHEWIQTGNGTMEAMPLDDTLAAAGPSRTLFRAADADWAVGARQPEGDTTYVTDGPELFRTRTGTLLMLWSSYDAKGYVQGLARSRTGTIEGPWEQLPPLLRGDSGHGMLFRRFDGQLMLVVHRPFKNARGKLYDVRDLGDRIALTREATELDGETHPVAPEGARHATGRSPAPQ